MTDEAGDPVSLDDVTVPAVPAPVQEPESYVPLKNPREKVRTWIALTLLFTLVAIIAAISATYMAGVINGGEYKELLGGIFTPVLGVFGAVTGFYYGTHASDSQG